MVAKKAAPSYKLLASTLTAFSIFAFYRLKQPGLPQIRVEAACGVSSTEAMLPLPSGVEIIESLDVPAGTQLTGG